MVKTKPTSKAATAGVYPTEGLAKVPEAARFLSVSRDTIYKMIKDREIAFVQVRDVFRIPWPELHAMASPKS